MPTLNVLSYNLHAGVGMDGRRDLERQLGVLRAASPDLLALQEVDRNTERSGGVDQAAFFAEGLGMELLFARAIDLEGGEYGVALLSRLPVISGAVLPLPHEAGHEDRVLGVLQLAPVAGGLESLWFGGTHLARHSAALRREQSEAIRRYFAALPCALLAGDFNATPEELAHWPLAQEWNRAALAPSFPAMQPTEAIDHLFFRTGLRLHSFGVLAEPCASDHRPVWAKFEIRADRDAPK